MGDAGQLEQALEAVKRERQRLLERLERRDAAALAPVERQRTRVGLIEQEHGEVSKRLELHQRELELLKRPPSSALGAATLARLGAVAWVLAASTQGLGSDGATLWGLSAVGCLLALMWGYFRG